MSPGELEEYRNQCIIRRRGPIPPGRIYAYETGYGDFCFLNGTDVLVRRRLKMENCYRKAHAKSLTSDKPHQFPFMKLPREIRNRIYQIVINSMCTRSDGKHEFPWFDALDLGIWSPEKRPVNHADYPAKPDGPEDEITQWFRMLHRDPDSSPARPKVPGRQYNYDLCAGSYGSFSSLQNRDDIRNLANTNSIIRKELAQVTFARTTIGLCSHSAEFVEYFLMDRPALWAGIKRIRLGLDIGFPPSKPKFLELLNIIPTILRLERLDITIHTNEKEIQPFLDRQDTPDWISAIRNFPVSCRFEMVLDPLPFDEDEWDNQEMIEELRTRYEGLIMEKIRPQKSLEKSSDEMNEVEQYMATRV